MEMLKKRVKQVLLTGQVTTIRQPSPQEQIEEPNRERLVKIAKERGKAWGIAALVDGSIGYHSVESAEQMIDALLKGKRICACERTMACFHSNGLAEIDHDFNYFGGKDQYAVERVRLLVNYVKEILRENKKRGRPRSWIEQTTESMMYPTSMANVGAAKT
jgi:hypothetical protein